MTLHHIPVELNIMGNGIRTDIEQLFKFVIHKFSKLVRFSKSDVLKMFSGISIFQDCEYLVKLAIDGLTALTAVVIYGEPEIVHYLLLLFLITNTITWHITISSVFIVLHE